MWLNEIGGSAMDFGVGFSGLSIGSHPDLAHVGIPKGANGIWVAALPGALSHGSGNSQAFGSQFRSHVSFSSQMSLFVKSVLALGVATSGILSITQRAKNRLLMRKKTDDELRVQTESPP
jgi:hypothetical protein